MIITNDLYYDTDKAVQFSKEKTGLDRETIVQVLNAEYGHHETTSNGISTLYLAKDPIIERSKKMITYDLRLECTKEFHKLIGLLTKEKSND